MISIGTKSISIGLGTPEGAKKPINFSNPCLYIAIIVTPMKIKKEIAKVTII